MHLPLRSRLWRAETAWYWQELRQTTPVADMTVDEAVSRLFDRSNPGLPGHLLSLGYYVLMHVLIQHVYLLKQTSLAAGPPPGTRRMMKAEDADDVTQALRVWQTSLEHRRHLRAAETGYFASAESLSGGSLTFNAMALLRLTHIRLYADMAPKSSLETRDSALIASALSGTASLLRGPRLHRAVLQAVHALSMLVKAGVKYVARAKSTEWSMQLSRKWPLEAEESGGRVLTEATVCNFECALVLAKWLLALSATTPPEPPASAEEKGVLEAVRRMLDETEFVVPVDPSLSGPSTSSEMTTSDGAKLRQLESAVVRLWAETFKGAHMLDLVTVMGASLDGYADLVDKLQGRGSTDKVASETGLA